MLRKQRAVITLMELLTMGAPSLQFQSGLFEAHRASFDERFLSVRRSHLDSDSWLDHAQGWIKGSDSLFEDLVKTRPWKQRSRRMFDRQMLEPRLTAPWNMKSGEPLPRKFLLRPKGGGPSLSFVLGRGDLLVTGGKTQRKWEHCVPKVVHAGPRISLAFRYGMNPRAYGQTQGT